MTFVRKVMLSGSSYDDHSVIVRELTDGKTVIVLSSAGNHAGPTWSSYIARSLPINYRAGR